MKKTALLLVLLSPVASHGAIVNFVNSSTYANGNASGNTAGGSLLGATYAQGVHTPIAGDQVFVETTTYLASETYSINFELFNRNTINIVPGETVNFTAGRFDLQQSQSALNVEGTLSVTAPDFTFRSTSSMTVPLGGILTVEAAIPRGGAPTVNVDGGLATINNLQMNAGDNAMTVFANSGNFRLGRLQNFDVVNDSMVINLLPGAEVTRLGFSNLSFAEFEDLISYDSVNYTLDFASGSDRTYSLTAVPEPSIALLGSLGVLGLLRRRR